MRKQLAGLLLLFLLLPLIAACGQTQPTTPAAEATTAPAAEPTMAPTEAAAAEPTMAPTEAAAAEPTMAPTEAAAAEPTEAAAAPTEAAGTTGGAGLKVGLVTDVGRINDGTFNQFAYEGLQRAEQELGVEIAYIETQAQTDYEKNFEQFASQDFDMIVGVGFLMGDALKAAAEKYPDIKFAIVDFAYDPPIANVQGLVFAEDQAGYLAGVLAAMLTQSGTIGVVGGVEIPPVQKFVMGYENGAKSVNPDIDVKKVYIDSFTDRARGGEAAQSFIAEGADVIFGAGGQTGSGGIQAAAQQGVWVIGVDQDEYGTTFQNGAAPGADKLISSAVKRVDNAVFSSIQALVDGNFEGGTTVYDASTEGVGLAPFHDAASAITPEIQARLDEVQQGLADGSITTNVTLP